MSSDESIKLVAGLGNPGSQYEATRHNVGYWLVDELARKYNGHFKNESKFKGEVAKIHVGGQDVWLIKPSTFMNLSGQSVSALARFYKIQPEQVLVVHDELDLDPGVARLKSGGGHGGHNGLRDVSEKMGKNYWRIRLGIGHPGHKSQVADYVLKKPSQDDRISLERAIDDALGVIELALTGDQERAMHLLHTNKR